MNPPVIDAAGVSTPTRRPGLARTLSRTLPRSLYHLALSDFRERSRRFSFLVMLALAIFLGYSVHSGDFSLTLGNYRGLLNSAWSGAQMVLVLTFMLSLFGFYLVKNSVERDTHTGVGQIIATTPLPRAAYLFGKWLSHFLVLGVLVMILAGAALVMQLWQQEAPVEPLVLLAPFLIIGLPCVAFVAGVVVLFESIAFLRGGLGNVVYFIAWVTMLPIMLTALEVDGPMLKEGSEPLGLGLLIPSIQNDLIALHPDYNGSFSIGIRPEDYKDLTIFRWQGPNWSLGQIARQWAWALAGAGLALLGGLFFERFDPSRHWLGSRLVQGRKKPDKTSSKTSTPAPASAILAAESAVVEPPATVRPEARLTPLGARPAQPAWVAFLRAFPVIYLAELRLLLLGRPWWWYLVAAGLVIGMLFSPPDTIRTGLLPAAWIWPVLVWSGLGCREKRYDTAQLVFSAPRPVWMQLPATWLAGATVAALTGIGGLAFGLSGDLPGLASWLAAVGFIPALALALGVWSGSSRPFEVIYLVWWYVGPMQRSGPLDYLSAPAGLYLALTAGLLLAAVIGRLREAR